VLRQGGEKRRIDCCRWGRCFVTLQALLQALQIIVINRQRCCSLTRVCRIEILVLEDACW
jgi:hypothetical protein